jgi:hypothetical protein
LGPIYDKLAREDSMGDPIGLALSIVQIIQAIKQGKELKDIKKDFKNDLADIRMDLNRFEQRVINLLPSNATREQIVRATTDALLNTPIKKIIMAGEAETIVTRPPKDMPPTTGGFFTPKE